MLCPRCGKNQVSVYFKQNINGVIKETALCGECANEINIPAEPFIPNDFNIFKGFIKKPSYSSESGAVKICTLCGSTINDIMQHGKTGCAKCYDTFKNELENIIVKIHGKTSHVGRAPKEYKEKNARVNKIGALKNKLKEAVENQEFEKAAELRDEINRCETGGV